jgi:hypothetical protein
MNVDPVGILVGFVSDVGSLAAVAYLACLVFAVFRVRALWHCWTGLLVVSGHRCFYVCGDRGDDFLYLSTPQILDRRGRVFLANGNEVRRLRNAELRAWLFEDELRATERNLKNYRKICVVRTPKVIGLSPKKPLGGEKIAGLRSPTQR